MLYNHSMRRKILILEKIKILPNLLVLIAFSGLVLYFGIIKTIEMHFSNPTERFKVALHFNDENYQNTLVTNLVKSQSSISNLIEVEKTESSFENTDSDVYIDVPTDFIKKILDGRNESANIYFKSNSYYERLIFTSLAKSASDMLASAQSSIYAAEDFLKSPVIENIRDELNRNLLEVSMEREHIFIIQNESSVFIDFISKGIVLLLLLTLVNIGKFWTNSRREINRSFILKGYSTIFTIFEDWLGFFIIYLFMIIILYFISIYFKFYLNILGLIFTALFISITSVYLSVFINEKRRENTLIAIFLISLFTLGIIFPIEILPLPIVKITNLLPQNLCSMAISGKYFGLLAILYIPMMIYATYKRRKI